MEIILNLLDVDAVTKLLLLTYWLGKALQDASLSTGIGFNPDAKYKSPKSDVHDLPLWYYAYHDINSLNHVEKFPLSATFLVMFTDFWHFCGFIRHLCVSTMVWMFTDLHWSYIIWFYIIGLIVFKIVYVGFRKISKI